MQRSQRFVADQRFDLPHYESMIDYIAQEFHAYNKSFFVAQNRIVKNWTVENNGGLQVKINKNTDSTLFNSERQGKHSLIVRKTTDLDLTLNLADNSTNYVEVQFSTELCAPDTVAIWDTTANAGQGEEYTQTVDTGLQEAPHLVSNTISFTGDADKMPLAIVTTVAGVITSVVDARKLLFHVEADWNFGPNPTRTDKTIGNFKDAYDALATALRECKGTPNWTDKPYSSAKLLKEYQNLFVTGGGNIGFEGVYGANNLAWTADLKIEIANRPAPYTIDAGQVAIQDGQAVWVDIPEDAPVASLTPHVTSITTVPIAFDTPGWTGRVHVLFFRRGNTVYGSMDIPELESGEKARIGEDLPLDLRIRLGITSETSYQAYASTTYIAAGDNYATALSKLDAVCASFAADIAREEYFYVDADLGQIDFNTTFEFNPANSIPDITVYKNGQKLKQSFNGFAAYGDFKKINSTTIQFFEPVPKGSEITIRDERTGIALAPGGGVDLTNCTTDIIGDLNGNRSLGESLRGFKALYLKDENSAQVYKVAIVNGVMTLTPVP